MRALADFIRKVPDTKGKGMLIWMETQEKIEDTITRPISEWNRLRLISDSFEHSRWTWDALCLQSKSVGSLLPNLHRNISVKTDCTSASFILKDAPYQSAKWELAKGNQNTWELIKKDDKDLEKQLNHGSMLHTNNLSFSARKEGPIHSQWSTCSSWLL